MLKNRVAFPLTILLGAFIAYAPTTKAQTTYESPESLLPLKKAPLSSTEPAAPAGKLPSVDLDNLQTPDGQKLEDPEILKAKTIAFMRSLTKEQKVKIKAILDANKSSFEAQLAQLKSATKAMNDVPDPQSLKDQDKIDEAIKKINNEIKTVLTKKQAVGFDATFPKKLSLPRNATALISTGDCYNAYYLYYVYNYGYYAYYAYVYAYYNYYYGSSDPASYAALTSAYDSFYYSYLAGLYGFYAYYYVDSTYAFYAWYFADHVTTLAQAGYNLAYRAYYWTGDSYAYNAWTYGYYAWYTSYYYGYGGEGYAYRCYYY